MSNAQQKLLEMYPTSPSLSPSSTFGDVETEQKLKQKMSQKAILIIKIIIISIAGSFIFSKIAYQFSGSLCPSFLTDGEPNIIIIGIHTVLFALLVYLIFTVRIPSIGP